MLTESDMVRIYIKIITFNNLCIMAKECSEKNNNMYKN